MKLSVVIPARSEFPNVVHTVHSIWNCWEADGFSPKDIEIILVDNCSDDDIYPQRGTKGTSSYLMGRGAYYSGSLRHLYCPIAGHFRARNMGAEIAKGEYLFFSDAHMAYKPGFFKYMMQTVDESGGMAHGGIAWMGSYPSHFNNGGLHGVGTGYSIKLGEEWKGTWNNYYVSEKDWFYVPALGHCSVMMKRKQFLDFKGYTNIHRTYGGGEMYLDFKWWMLGSTVAVHPKAIGYHLASGRGYSYDHDDYIENVLGMMYALGIDDWRERAYLNWMRKGRKEVLDKILERNEKEYAGDRAFMEKYRKKTFNELIVQRPWDELNMAKYGKKCGALTIFQDSWLNLLSQSPQYVQDAYTNSKYQKGLAEFIENNLSEFVYKRV